jgi:hypothetical protein
MISDRRSAPIITLSFRVLEVSLAHALLVEARGVERRLVHQVRQVRAAETRGAARNQHHIHVVGQRDLLGVNLEDALAAPDVGPVDDNPPIEATGTKQRRIEDVGTIGRGDQDDAFVRLEAVHFDEQLIQRLLALVMPATEARATMTADSVDLVDEHDARRVLLTLLEQVADARRADADEHLDEVRAADREERHIGFTGHRTRQQRFAGARRSHEQDAFRDAPAELLEFLRLAQEIDDLL